MVHPRRTIVVVKRTPLFCRFILVVVFGVQWAGVQDYVSGGDEAGSARGVLPASFHEYSFAEEHSLTYVAGVAKRPYANYHGVSCAYDPLWLLLGSSHWAEVGIVHGCPGFAASYPGVWLYSYLCDSTVCGFIWSKNINANGTRHKLRISIEKNFTNPTIGIYVDGLNQQYDYYGGGKVKKLQVGLESYDDSAKITYHSASKLSYKVKGSKWKRWAGFDYWFTDKHMCGYWGNAHLWYMGGADKMQCPLRSVTIALACASVLAGCGAAPDTGNAAGPSSGSHVVADSPEATSSGSDQCHGVARQLVRKWGTITTMPGDFEVSGREASAWESRQSRGGVAGQIRVLAQVKPTADVSLCIFHGVFRPPIPWPPDVHEHPFPWIVVSVVDGRAGLYEPAMSDIWSTDRLAAAS